MIAKLGENSKMDKISTFLKGLRVKPAMIDSKETRHAASL